MTVNDLISSSMRLVGILGASDTPTSTESNHALQTLNDMIDAWSTQNLLLYAKTVETFTLVPNQQTYQMGTGAPDFNTVRPLKIENANWEQVQGSTTFSLSIEIINQDQFAALTVPSTTSNLPTKLFVNYTFPYATLYFWPVPSQANSLQLWSWKQLSQFSLLTTTVSLPPGYNEAIRYNLAVRLAPEYGRQLDPLIADIAMSSKADIKRMNTKLSLLQIDAAALPHKPTWNWLTGE